MTYLYDALVSLVFFSTLIAIHELGHYIASTRLTVRVRHIVVGVGPLIYTHQGKGKTWITIRLFPLVGYLTFPNPDAEGRLDAPWRDASPWSRIGLFLAGPAFNATVAVLLLLLALPLLPTVNRGALVLGARDVARPYLQPGDVVLAVDTAEVRADSVHFFL